MIKLPGGTDEDPVRQQKFDALQRLVVDTGGISLTVLGPFSANSGSLVAGTEATITVNHSYGVAPVSIWGGLQDGTWAAQFGWRWVGNTTNAQIVFNNHGPNTGTAILKFFMVF